MESVMAKKFCFSTEIIIQSQSVIDTNHRHPLFDEDIQQVKRELLQKKKKILKQGCENPAFFY